MAESAVRPSSPAAGYSDEPKPLGSYALIAAGFNAAFGAALVAAAHRGRLPEKIAAADVLLLGVATHKLSRLVAKDTVTSFIRAPFVEYQGAGGANELDETPRGEGLRRAVGELLFCPQCVGLWIGAGLVAALARSPRATRAVAGAFAVQAVSDFLHLAYQPALQRAFKE